MGVSVYVCCVCVCTCACEFVSVRAGKFERGLRVTTRGERLYVRTVAYIATSEKIYGRIRIQTMSPLREIFSPPFFSPLRLTLFSVVLFSLHAQRDTLAFPFLFFSLSAIEPWDAERESPGNDFVSKRLLGV